MSQTATLPMPNGVATKAARPTRLSADGPGLREDVVRRADVETTRAATRDRATEAPLRRGE